MCKRLIPLLLMDRDQRLVKSIQFGERTYIGDPFNVLRLFNEREVDEICVLDIDATKDKRKPNFDYLAQLASECFMPLAYGGGISSIDDCRILNRIGIEKFIIKHSVLNTDLIAELVDEFGSQALIACIDYKSEGSDLVVDSQYKISPLLFAQHCQEMGFGELILQNMDCDGMREGYDLQTVAAISKAITIPVIALGGAGTYDHLASVLKAGASAASSGSVFSFVGRLRGVLINYPDPLLRTNIAGDYQ